MASTKNLYFDFNATTPVDPRVLETMLPYFSENFGNSVSVGHSYGWEAEKAVEKARAQAAFLLDCEPKELTFTSGATESNNWAIESLIEAIRTEEGATAPIHFLISPVEHSSVIQASRRAAAFFGVEVEWLPVNAYGQIEVATVAARLKPHTRLVSAMWVQNEVGSVNPIQELAELCREKQVYLLSDATQAIGKIPLSLRGTPVSLLSFSAHKLSGPKGVGLLYMRARGPHVRLPPLLCGGGHEKGLRSGTLNVPAIVGLGRACEIALTEGAAEQKKLRELRDRLWKDLRTSFPTARLNGHPTLRSPNNLHVTFLDCRVPPVLQGLAASRGSACTSGKTSMSHVLAALGFSEAEAAQSLRLSLGRPTTIDDIEEAVVLLSRQIVPLNKDLSS